MPDSLGLLRSEIEDCRACERLVSWREEAARTKVKRFRSETYWGRPVPGFGDPAARLVIVGLAPAAHGANRTGRMFTGDRSGDWLYRALYRAGFASQERSAHLQDGLTLRDCFITAAARCAPPHNKPTAAELDCCRGFLDRELRLLRECRVLLALGRIGFAAALKSAVHLWPDDPSARPVFGHGSVAAFGESRFLVGCYHPSQQNTFTGRLTEEMLDQVFATARELIAAAL